MKRRENNEGVISESEDIRDNVTTATQAVDRNTGVSVSSVIVPTSIQPQVQIQNYGQVVESISTTAITNRYVYDGLNRRITTTDGRGNTSTTVYNALSQVAYTEDAATNRTSYVYDQYGRSVETIDALGHSTYTVYDLRGNAIKQYGATYPVWYEYDAQGRMIAMATTRDTDLDPATIDSLDHPSLDVTQWTYDPATGLLVQKLYDDGKGPSYTYTPDGKLASRIWARGVVTEYDYSSSGELASIDYSDTTPDVTYTYDRLGRQLSAVAAGVSTNLYAYSANTLEFIAETQNGIVINRSRDAYGREGGIALEADYDVSYGYDTYGRFAAVTHAQSTNTFEYSYLPGSPLVSGMTASSGHAWTRSYESNRNLITAVTNSFDGNLISAFDYVNDPIGRRAARLDVLPNMNATTNTFGYNVRSEVTSAAMGTNTYGYVFDPIGNRITVTNNTDVASYTANALNQYTAISNAVPVLPKHDGDGNTTAIGDGWQYAWNGENRLVLASNTTHVVSYIYDHHGRMIWKTVASPNAPPIKTIAYLWNDYNIIAETVAKDTVTNTTCNIWGLDLDGTLQGAGGVGGLLAVISSLPLGEGGGGPVYIPTWDANGNVMEYVSSDGTIVAHREYDPLGGTVVVTGDADAFTHWFSTKPWCAVTGQSEYQFRKYSPVLGRWLSRDPIGARGGVNVLGFCGNDSVQYFDAFGKISMGWGGAPAASIDSVSSLTILGSNSSSIDEDGVLNISGVDIPAVPGNMFDPSWSLDSDLDSASGSTTFAGSIATATFEFTHANGCTYFCFSWSTDLLGASVGISVGEAFSPVAITYGLSSHLGVTTTGTDVGINYGAGIPIIPGWSGSVRLLCLALPGTDDKGCPCENSKPISFAERFGY